MFIAASKRILSTIPAECEGRCDLGVLFHSITPRRAFDTQVSKFALSESNNVLPDNNSLRTIAEGLTHGRPWMPTQRQECYLEDRKQSPSSRCSPRRSALGPQTPVPQKGTNRNVILWIPYTLC